MKFVENKGRIKCNRKENMEYKEKNEERRKEVIKI